MFPIDPHLALERYRRLSTRYDYTTRRIEPVRSQTIDALRLERGQRVLDVACGTGKSFEMLRQARERVREGGWDNVQLIESTIASADLEGPFDAVLFVYTQDVLQSDAALARIFAATRPGARVASTGLKLFPWYVGIANAWLLAISYPYFTTFKGLTKPWAPLKPYVKLHGVRSTFFGSGYIAEGVRRGHATRKPADSQRGSG